MISARNHLATANCPYEAAVKRTVVGVNHKYADGTFAVKESSYGFGLFACKDLEEGLILLSYEGTRRSLKDAELEEDFGNFYLFEVVANDSDRVIEVIDGRHINTASVARYVNAPPDWEASNACWCQHGGKIFLEVALYCKNIK